MRCSTYLAPVAIYLVTATLLELYWMRNAAPGTLSPPVREDSSTLKAATQPAANQHMESPPPPPPLPPPPSPFPKHKASIPKRSSRMDPPSPRQYAGASHAAAKAESLPAAGGSCWPLPRPFFEAPFNASMASVVWTRPLDTEFGPLDDVPEKERDLQHVGQLSVCLSASPL